MPAIDRSLSDCRYSNVPAYYVWGNYQTEGPGGGLLPQPPVRVFLSFYAVFVLKLIDLQDTGGARRGGDRWCGVPAAHHTVTTHTIPATATTQWTQHNVIQA